MCAAILAGCTSTSVPNLGPSPRWVPVGQARVDADTRTVVVTGYVNMVEGPIELLACGAGGKRHESIFVMEASPVDLQTALLLAGARAGKPMRGVGEGPPHGSALDLWVEWKDGAARRIERAEHFIFNHETRRPLDPTPWMFTGSVIEDGKFRALSEESFVATYWDPWAVVNIGSRVGANDEILSAMPDRIPAVETPVTFYLRLR